MICGDSLIRRNTKVLTILLHSMCLYRSRSVKTISFRYTSKIVSFFIRRTISPGRIRNKRCRIFRVYRQQKSSYILSSNKYYFIGCFCYSRSFGTVLLISRQYAIGMQLAPLRKFQLLRLWFYYEIILL